MLCNIRNLFFLMLHLQIKTIKNTVLRKYNGIRWSGDKCALQYNLQQVKMYK